MSDDAKAPDETTPAPMLRREALLPSERSRGLGTVAVVCTMAGVASGLALATTLMAMQVADTMSARSACTYHRATPIEVVPTADDTHGFLGIRYTFHDGFAEVDSILPSTPAESVGLRSGDRVLSVDGDHVDSANELQERIYNARPGARPLIVIQRSGSTQVMHPTLIAWPTNPTY